MRLPIALIVPAALLAGMCSTAVAADAPHNVRGTLTAVTSATITVATATGVQTIALGPKTAIAGVVPARAADITPGSFIGTANVPAGTSARALEVVIFPPAMAGLGEGDYPWDLPAGGGHSTMTNGTVKSRGGSSMTNATVASTSGGAAKTVTLTYKGGTKTVAIPASAPVVRIVPGKPSFLVAGAHVFVIPGAAGAPAAFVVVGRQGAVPPM